MDIKWAFPIPNCYDGLKESEVTNFLTRWRSLEDNPCLKWLTGREQPETSYPAKQVIGWLYELVRSNIKRGRVFDLTEVFPEGLADCLGYAKLFTLLGRVLGLNTGVIEVVIDNSGRYVPHTAVLVKLEHGQWQCVDLWYGSKNINHRRLGLQVKQGNIMQIEDIEQPDLSNAKDICYLPDSCINAITLYVYGNRHLNREEFNDAVQCYSQALELYPGNARFLYNRALAYENLGESQKARADYTQALSDEKALVHLLAREHEEIISLISLDTKRVDGLSQEIYLLHQGFITGEKVSIKSIARKFDLPETEVAAILTAVEAKLAAGSAQD